MHTYVSYIFCNPKFWDITGGAWTVGKTYVAHVGPSTKEMLLFVAHLPTCATEKATFL
jgi:hypothetical protein